MTASVKSALRRKLQYSGLASSYDIVCDIAIIRLPGNLKSKRLVIAEAILQTQRHIKTVLHQASAVSGDFRLRRLKWVAGEKKTVATHKEFGCV